MPVFRGFSLFEKGLDFIKKTWTYELLFLFIHHVYGDIDAVHFVWGTDKIICYFLFFSRNRGWAKKTLWLVKTVLTTGVLIWLIFHYAGSSMKDKILWASSCVLRTMPGTSFICYSIWLNKQIYWRKQQCPNAIDGDNETPEYKYNSDWEIVSLCSSLI